MSEVSVRNPYRPMPVRVVSSKDEPEDEKLRSILVEFVNLEDKVGFKYLPGQFCMLSLFGYGEAPFSIASSPMDGKNLQFIIHSDDELATKLHSLEEGDILGLRGPLGNGFPVEQFAGYDVVIIGSGKRIANLCSLFWYLVSPQNREHFGKITVVLGAKTPSFFNIANKQDNWDELVNVCMLHTICASEIDGDSFFSDVSAVLKESAADASNSFVAISAPSKALKQFVQQVTELGFQKDKIYVSLERHIKCGIGKCGRCNIGHRFICTDGPIFSKKELENLKFDV